jgi:hypothetical protein
MNTRPQHPVAAVIGLAAMVGLASAMESGVSANGEEVHDMLIRKIVAQTTRSGLTIRATRDMKAGTLSGKHQGWMHVETQVAPNGSFSYLVVEEGGSERTREKVLRALLDAEAQAGRAGADEVAALTTANYQFTPIAAPAPGQMKLKLTPRRADPKLIEGTLTVTNDGCPIVLEGRLAKSPSFWVRSVTVVKHFGRFAGVALPVMVESLADVKMVGKSSFSMRYSYSEVNGRSLPQPVASASSFGPSAELLALHASLTQGQ